MLHVILVKSVNVIGGRGFVNKDVRRAHEFGNSLSAILGMHGVLSRNNSGYR